VIDDYNCYQRFFTQQAEEEVRALQKKMQQLENDLDQAQEALMNANNKLEEKDKALTNVSRVTSI
jgi:predicted  nucleic acid-binding Zn-ribbon protein